MGDAEDAWVEVDEDAEQIGAPVNQDPAFLVKNYHIGEWVGYKHHEHYYSTTKG